MKKSGQKPRKQIKHWIQQRKLVILMDRKRSEDIRTMCNVDYIKLDMTKKEIMQPTHQPYDRRQHSKDEGPTTSRKWEDRKTSETME